MEQHSVSIEQDKKPTYKYCIVPNCKNSIRNTPDKVFFFVPRGVDKRNKWCKAMKRDMISSSTSVYCCEDHFDVETDTVNYVEYKIYNLQGKHKTLRLKNGILPHKFESQEDSLVQPLILTKDSVPLANQIANISESTTQHYVELGISLASSQVNMEETTNTYEASCSTSIQVSNENKTYSNKSIQVTDSVCSENKTYMNKAIQVNSKIQYRSKSVNVNLCAKTKSIAVSPFHNLSKTASTSPLKSTCTPVKRKLFQDKTDKASIFSTQPSLLSSSSYDPNLSSPESSWIREDESENERLYKNQMRSCMVTAIEKEPKMLLGLPKRSYYLIKLLSENIPLPVIDILITLKKIKLNESFDILALQFGYVQSTISRIFSKSVLLLADKMKDLIIFPTPIQIFNNLPITFRARYSNVVSIIDCLEIEIEKPSNALFQSLTWSQYKRCNTLKYLISCTPDGLVNFISEGYSGRATDIMIVEDCGFLKCLPSKTAVMADRGFKNLSYLLGKKDCILIRPPSVNKTTPSSKEEVKQSKRIAALRIHVERVISRLREFNMLLPHACVDHNLIPIIDDVIVIACGLINMQDVLIKK